MIQIDEAGPRIGRAEDWITRRRTETTRRDVSGDENRDFARLELRHDAEGEGRRRNKV